MNSGSLDFGPLAQETLKIKIAAQWTWATRLFSIRYLVRDIYFACCLLDDFFPGSKVRLCTGYTSVELSMGGPRTGAWTDALGTVVHNSLLLEFGFPSTTSVMWNIKPGWMVVNCRAYPLRCWKASNGTLSRWTGCYAEKIMAATHIKHEISAPKNLIKPSRAWTGNSCLERGEKGTTMIQFDDLNKEQTHHHKTWS